MSKADLTRLNFQDYTILIIDDNPINLQTTSDYLDKCGFHIAVARDGGRALQIAVLSTLC